MSNGKVQLFFDDVELGNVEDFEIDHSVNYLNLPKRKNITGSLVVKEFDSNVLLFAAMIHQHKRIRNLMLFDEGTKIYRLRRDKR